MIPATFGTLLGFLGLVAPGLVYSAIIERRRPREGESAFAEASRVGLTSLVFSLVSMVLLWLLQRYESSALYKYTKLSLPNIGLWLAGGNKYAAGNLGKVFFGLAAEVILACILAAAAAWLLTRRPRSRFRKEGVYRSVFTRYAPKDSFPWVYVKLDDKTEFWGYHRLHEDRDGTEARAIVLAGEKLMRRCPGEQQRQRIGEHWDIVVIDSSKIQFMQVIYQDRAGVLRGARTDSVKEGKVRAFKPSVVTGQVTAGTPENRIPAGGHVEPRADA
ncbi:MAG TPA: DUF6338 family protein [Streptosporangiaceae bacterium]|nr:DUF6338 family protein [Streptosporangiaceae bacterium]